MKIAQSIIKLVTPILASYYSDAELSQLFAMTGFPSPPSGSTGSNRWAVCQAWLERLNAETGVDGVAILGSALRGYMDFDGPGRNYDASLQEDNRDRIQAALEMNGLRYSFGGVLASCAARRPVVGGLYFMLLRRELDKLDRVLDSIVFVGKNLGFEGEPDEKETWYFQDVRSYHACGAYPNHTDNAVQNEIRVVALEENEIFFLFDTQRLALRLYKHADKEERAKRAEDLATRFRLDSMYFMIRYEDPNKLFLNPISLKFAGNDTQKSDPLDAWPFEDVSPYGCQLRSPDTPDGDCECVNRMRHFRNGDLTEIVDSRGLAEELLQCRARRLKAGIPD